MDLSHLTLVDRGVTLAAPSIAFTLALDTPEWTGILQLYERARAALGPALTHVVAESRKSAAKLDARAETMVPTWAQKPRDGKSYFAHFTGAAEGITAATLTLSVQSLPALTPELAERRRDNWRALALQGTTPRLPITLLRVSFPLDHALAEPGALGAWIHDLDLVRHRPFAAGYAGVALNHAANIGSTTARAAMERHLAVTCTRHPGLDWFTLGSLATSVLAFDSVRDAIVPLVKRPDWLLLLSDRTLAVLGGRDDFAAALRAAVPPETPVLTQPLAEGLSVRTGAAPDALEPARHGVPAHLTALARALRPARMTGLAGPAGVPETWVTDWLTVFDTPAGSA